MCFDTTIDISMSIRMDYGVMIVDYIKKHSYMALTNS